MLINNVNLETKVTSPSDKMTVMNPRLSILTFYIDQIMWMPRGNGTVPEPSHWVPSRTTIFNQIYVK